MSSRIVNMTVPEALLKEADEVARAEGRTRSELFREAVRRYVRSGAGGRKDSKPLLARLARLACQGSSHRG
jgi:metal-responsive CopG/Arc/MetJ family transcriptional regulator